MSAYLFGFAVQGIQKYIFETNRLREIAGGSELVESICDQKSGLFSSCVNQHSANKFSKEQVMRSAAGEIRYVFKDRESCAQVVREFPKMITQIIPGVEFSQAVAKIKNGDLQTADEEVRIRLMEQRNRNKALPAPAWMVHERARRTGNPAVGYRKSKYSIDKKPIDLRQQKKYAAVENGSNRLFQKLTGKDIRNTNNYPHEMEDLVAGERGWIAVLHADGSNIGRLIMDLLKNVAVPSEHEGITYTRRDAYRLFSETLEAATCAAAQSAFEEVIEPAWEKEGGKLPIRPVVLGGDDLTVIIRGTLALPFAHVYLRAFEEETRRRFEHYAQIFKVENFTEGLTAGAGIAYVKPKYPFHYAVDLAEELCSFAKKLAKKIEKDHAPSALHFHKVQSSFVTDYEDDIIPQELTDRDGRHLTAGPYFLKEQSSYYTIQQLENWIQVLLPRVSYHHPLEEGLGQRAHSPQNAIGCTVRYHHPLEEGLGLRGGILAAI